jgi:hypothetical protein
MRAVKIAYDIRCHKFIMFTLEWYLVVHGSISPTHSVHTEKSVQRLHIFI